MVLAVECVAQTGISWQSRNVSGDEQSRPQFSPSAGAFTPFSTFLNVKMMLYVVRIADAVVSTCCGALQDRIKRDPSAYRDEFDVQVRVSCSMPAMAAIHLLCVCYTASQLPRGAGAVQDEAQHRFRILP